MPLANGGFLIGSYYYTLPEWITLSTTSIYFVLFAFIVFCISRPFGSILRPFVLLIANCIFLYSFSKYHLYAVLLLAIISYIFSWILKVYKDKIIFCISLLPFILLLLFFKYYKLFLTSSIIMPLGLSFYTFKILAYLIDVYQDKVEVTNPLFYLDYVLFFPAITAGPIHDYASFIDTIKSYQVFDYKAAKGGGFQMCLGIFEKLVFCSFISQLVPVALGLTGMNALLGVFLYSLEIYLDFDSISNIAIGCARLLGFDLVKNFNSPYVAYNLQDFWRRWHISLSTWFRNYVYIPLGGNRKGTFRRYLNLTIVFILSGIWHGNTWNFLLWGLLHAILSIIEQIIAKYVHFPENKVATFFIKIPMILFNFVLVSFLWLIFRYPTMGEVMTVLHNISIKSALDLSLLGITPNEITWLKFIVVVTIILDILRSHFNMINVFNKIFFPIRWVVYVALIVMYMIFGVYGGNGMEASDFIYQWF